MTNNAATATASTRWNRCTSNCGCANVNVRDINCTCNGGCERGAKERYQMRRYAADILTACDLWDGSSEFAICPLTGLDFAIADGEVDKVNPEGGYTPGNVVLTSRAGNQERGKVQQWHGDIAGVEAYAAMVASAAMTISVTPFHLMKKGIVSRIAQRANEGMATDPKQSNVQNGPYGK